MKIKLEVELDIELSKYTKLDKSSLLKLVQNSIDNSLSISHKDKWGNSLGYKLNVREPELKVSKRDNLVLASQLYDGNRKSMAKHLGVSERTIYRMLNKYKLNV